MLVECYISVKGVNKYLSNENKLPHTCKNHLEVTKETVKNSPMKQFAHIFAQMKQFSSNRGILSSFGSKVPVLD